MATARIALANIRPAANPAESVALAEQAIAQAAAGSLSTSAVIPLGDTLLAYRPYGKEGLLAAELDLTAATGVLAWRLKPT